MESIVDTPPHVLPLQSRLSLTHLSPRSSLSPLPAMVVSRRQLQSLNGKIRQEVGANRRRFQKLLGLNPYFSMKLLAPANSMAAEECHSGSMGKMMRQLDLLLEEGNLLEKEIKKAELRRMQVDHQDPSLRDELKHHFAFLRRLWVDPGREDGGAVDRLEELNKKVVIIKNGIIAAADHEKKRHELFRSDHYDGVERRAKQTIRETEEYRKLRENYEGMCMRLEEKEARLSSIVQSYEEKIQQKQKESLRWRRDAQQLRKTNVELKEKVLVCELKETRLSQRILHLQGELLKGKTKPQLKENTEINDGLAFMKEGFANQIKFRKMDFDPVRRNNFDQKLPLSDKVLPDSHHPNNEEAVTSHSLPEHTPLPEETKLPPMSPISDQKCEETTRDGLLTTRESRSIDGRKGRFARMRSPANGKLIKPRGEEDRRKEQMECLSPRLREMRDEVCESVAMPKACQL